MGLHFVKLLSLCNSERRQLDELSKIECAAVLGRSNWLGIGYEGQIRKRRSSDLTS